MTPLHAASAGGQITVVKHLLDSDVDVDVLNADGNSALHVACLNGQDMVVTELISVEAALNQVNNKGQVGLSGLSSKYNDIHRIVTEL